MNNDKKNLLLSFIGEEQIKMINKNKEVHNNEVYLYLEELKIRIKQGEVWKVLSD